LAFQLKLLWLSGYLPHLQSCVECGAEEDLVGFLPRAGGAVCGACSEPGTVGLTTEAADTIVRLVHSTLADATQLELGPRAARETLSVVTTSYEHHGGFRLRTLAV